MEANVIIRKYDDKRICLLPHEGFPKDYALWLEKYAKTHFWQDVKIVRTQDNLKLLGVVCKPKTWLKVIKYFRSKGAIYPIGFEDNFMTTCLNVLGTQEAETMVHKEDLNDIEKKAVHEILERVPDAEYDEEKVERDADKIIKDNEEARGL